MYKLCIYIYIYTYNHNILMSLVISGESHIEVHAWFERRVVTVAAVTVRRLHRSVF